MKFHFLIFFFLLVFSMAGLSQGQVHEPAGLKKNSFYATGGIYIEEMYVNLTANYERLLAEFPKSFFHGLQIRVGAGPWVGWTDKGINIFSVMSVLMGKGSSHLETGAGVLYTYWTSRDEWQPLVNDRHLAGNIGYRYQKHGGKYILRAGLGWPEGYYISIGFCF